MCYPLISEYVAALNKADGNLREMYYYMYSEYYYEENFCSMEATAVVFYMCDKKTGNFYALKCFKEGKSEGNKRSTRESQADVDGVRDGKLLFSSENCSTRSYLFRMLSTLQCETKKTGEGLSELLGLLYMNNLLNVPVAFYQIPVPLMMLARVDYRMMYDLYYVTDEWGVEYSNDRKCLIWADVGELVQNSRKYTIEKGTQMICESAFHYDDCEFEDDIDMYEKPAEEVPDFEIEIPDSVTHIGIRAFYNLVFLKSIVIPDSVISLGGNVFDGCSNLQEIVVPKSVKTMHCNPFGGWYGKLVCLSPEFVYEAGVLYNKEKDRIISYRNYKSSSYTIPEGVKRISNDAFCGCSSLKSIIIPKGVECIGSGAFWYCSSLESIVIPESVKSIGSYAFSDCRSLKNVVIPESVKSIGRYAFWNCSSLESIVIPEGVKSIGSFAFLSCSSLKSVIIPEGVKSIGSFAFLNCSSLKSVIIPEKVESIIKNAFDGCSSLEYLEIRVKVGDYMERNGKDIETNDLSF